MAVVRFHFAQFEQLAHNFDIEPLALGFGEKLPSSVRQVRAFPHRDFRASR